MSWLRSTLWHLFPPPRRALRWWDGWPLAFFLVAFAGIVLWLELTDRILFERPWWFVLTMLAPWIWWMSLAGGVALSAGRRAVATIIRLVLFALLVIVLAEPRSVRITDQMSVVYALDISDSIGEGSTERARQFFAGTASQKPAQDQVGLVVFGGNAAVEFPPRKSLPPNDIAINSLIEQDATNLEQALSLSATMIPSDLRGKIVLITDGTATEGSLSRVLDELASRGIPVDVLPIDYIYDEEVWLEQLELPRRVKLGENYEASVVLASRAAGQGTLVLRENGEIIRSRKVEFQKGKDRFTFPVALRQPGYYEYEAIIKTPTNVDHMRENNRVVGYLFIAGEGKVLLVTELNAQRDWQRIAQTLKEADRLVEQITPFQLPRDVLQMMSYDCIMFVNLPADRFDDMQLHAVHDAVKNLGIGFAMIGGPNSFGPGGYHRTAIERALPVTMDITKRKILPKAALAIILHTCEFPAGNTWAKRITKEAIRVLGDQDEVGVIAYTMNGAEWIVDMTEAGNYQQIVPKINSAVIGDMPAFGPTMNLALKGLLNSDAATKHMIIISDGDPSPPTPDLLNKFKKAKISISTVAVFPHGGRTIGTLKAIAAATGGRFYFPADPNALPAIFIKEAKTLKRSMIQNRTVQPRIVRGLHPILEGINAVPVIHGYTLVTAKSMPAEVLLNVPSDQDVAPEGHDPILAVWQYGLGRSAAFMSDLSPNWGKEWLRWDQFEPFVKQFIQYVSRVAEQGHLRVSTSTEGNRGVIVAEDFHPEEMFLDVTATIIGPDDKSKQVTLRQTGPRRYQAEVPLWGEGRYQVLVSAGGGDRQEQETAGFIVPYSPEYLRFRSSPIVLEKIARRTGGELLTNPATAKELKTTAEEIFPEEREPKASSSPVFDWFLIAIACLLPLDIAVRRVQLDWRSIRDLFRWRRADSGATMGRLLARKREVQEEMPQASRQPPPSTIARPSRSQPSSKPTPRPRQPPPEQKKKPPTPKPPASDEGTTTSRLLDRKRRRQEKPPEDSE